MITILNCVAYDHDLRLLGFAAAICVFGCFTSVMLLHRAVQSRARTHFWLIAAGTILGCSVWSLHFVAMLAYMPGLPMAFDAAQTAFSIVVAVSGAIASIILWRRYPGALGSIIGGVGIGLSVAGMHYVGVNAMRFGGLSWFDYRYVSLSIIASLAFATIAFERTKGIARSLRKAEVTAWLSLSICSLHFIGMAGLTIVPTTDVAEVTGLNSTQLAIVISAFVLVFLVACFVAIIFENHLTYRTHRELSRMRLMNDLTQEALIVHRDGRVLEVNSAGTRLIGSSTATIEGKLISDLFAADDVPGLTRRSQCDPERRLPEEYSLVTRDQRVVPVEFSCRPIDFMGKPATVVALRDLSGRKRNEERINYLAHYDALTGALNRVALHDRLALETELASDRSGELALLYLDLDRFKPVNDIFGHAAGDEVLLQASKRIRAALAPSDLLARVGGDEFVAVIIRPSSLDAISRLAANVAASLRVPFKLDGQTVEIAASVGIALYPTDGRHGEELLRAADTAMYQAKADRRGSFCFFQPEMTQKLQARRELEQELASAIRQEQLELFYQPMVNGRNGSIETYEALIRWRHPVKGMISPADFIPLAEQCGLIDSIGEWVIESACRSAANWPHPWRVSINVSPSQFAKSDIPAIVASALSRHRLAPSRLVVEITEAVFIADTARAVETLSKLRDLGIRIALDDFGTGYSSLSYLQIFKFDKFKIDQSFVRRLSEGSEPVTIIKAIVNLGHNLGLQVTAEGVETLEQATLLRSLGCDQMQGYFFGRPAPLTVEGLPAEIDVRFAA